MALVQEMKNNGVRMDSVMYGTLLSICAANNLTEEAEKYFQQMKDEGCHPNLFHYSSLLNAYAVDRDHVKAEKLVNDMKSSGVAPNKVCLTFTSMLFLCFLILFQKHGYFKMFFYRKIVADTM